jgi:predicted DNA-binding protein YlxM (UPF0122 family)
MNIYQRLNALEKEMERLEKELELMPAYMPKTRKGLEDKLDKMYREYNRMMDNTGEDD